MTNSEISKAIDEYIHSERDRAIIRDRLINGLTFDELADKYHLCTRQLARITKKADVFLVKRS